MSLSDELLDSIDGAEETAGRDSQLTEWARMAKEIEDVRDSWCAEYTKARDERDCLIEALKVVDQFVLEVQHAQEAGARWYTRGENGLRAQIQLWLGKARAAIRAVKHDGGCSNFNVMNPVGVYLGVKECGCNLPK